MSFRPYKATLMTAMVVLTVGCGSPGASSGSATATQAGSPATSVGPTSTSTSSPSAAPSEAASSPGNLAVVIDGVSYTCSQMFSPTGDECPANVVELWSRWSSGMQTYLDSDRLRTPREVLLPPMSTQQLLAFGFAACVTAEGHAEGAAKAFPEFLKFVRDGRPDADENAVSEMYLAALQHLCKDVSLG